MLKNIPIGKPPPDMRRNNGNEEHGSAASLQVDGFLQFMYDNMAEPLAEGVATDENPWLVTECQMLNFV